MTSELCTIIGMGRGISYAVAQRFAREGFQIGMIGRNERELRGIERELPGSRGIAADAGDEAALTHALDELGAPSVLVFNASSGHEGPVTALKPEDAIADFRVNVGGLLIAVQHTVPAMRAASHGTILVTGGGLALKPAASLASLSIGKAAQRSLALSLAAELEPSGIHVATITVCGFVQPGGRFAAELIAEEYWRLHTQTLGNFETEVVYK